MTVVSRLFASTLVLGTLIAPASALAGAKEALSTGATFELISKGKGPKVVLRYEPSIGDREVMQMETAMSMSMSMNDMDMPSTTIPTSVLQMTLTIEGRGDDGSIHYSYRLDGAKALDGEGIDPTVLATMDTALAGTVGITGRATSSNRGLSLSNEAEYPPGTEPAIVEQVENSITNTASTVLPEDKVGVGARWRTIDLLDQGGMLIEQATTYTLTSIQDSTISLDVNVAQKPGTEELNLDGLPPGATAEFEAFDSAGVGSITIDLGHLTPTRSEMSVDLAMTMKINAGGQEMKTSTTVGTQVAVTRQ